MPEGPTVHCTIRYFPLSNGAIRVQCYRSYVENSICNTDDEEPKKGHEFRARVTKLDCRFDPSMLT